jgi:hypothetical protein
MRLQGREEHWQTATWRRRRCQPKAECWNVCCLSKLYDRERAESWNDWEEGGGWVMRAGLCERMQVAAGQRPPSLLGQLSEPGPMRRCLEVVARHHAAARAYKRHKCGWKCGTGHGGMLVSSFGVLCTLATQQAPMAGCAVGGAWQQGVESAPQQRGGGAILQGQPRAVQAGRQRAQQRGAGGRPVPRAVCIEACTAGGKKAQARDVKHGQCRLGWGC